MKSSAFLSIVSVGTLLLVWPRVAFAGCNVDNDCKGNRVCVDGRCVAQQQQQQGNEDYGSQYQAAAPTSRGDYREGQGQQGPSLEGWHYRHPKMHGLGIAFFITGLALDVVGGAMLGGGVAASSDSGNAIGAAGLVTVGIGAIFWITGIVLWAAGSGKDPGPAEDASIMGLRTEARSMLLPVPYGNATGGTTLFRF